ncbi:MAG: molybdopterin molybdotransferase MoeA [Terracidiphilus sp.]|jgi:molybdopterin molybdotransferase
MSPAPLSTGSPNANPGSASLLSFQEAFAHVSAFAARSARLCPPAQRVPLGKALDRVLAESISADADQPPFARSTRDGFACRASEVSRHRPLAIAGSTRAGQPPSGLLPRGSAWEIMTGGAVPPGADAVVMLEHVEIAGAPSARTIRLLSPRTVERGDNVVARAAQARTGDHLLPAGTLIGPAQIALAAACGCSTLSVFARPRVAILATGDELVPIRSTPAPGQVRDSSSAMLSALVSAAGGEPWVLPVARDTARSLDAAIARASAADVLLIAGGVSAGKFDLVEPALARAGARFHFTGVRIQPGKPLVFAELPARITKTARGLRRTQCCFGLPGNPVSSAVTFLLFAVPVVAALAGRRERGPRFALARLGADAKAKAGLTRFLPASCTFAGPLPEVVPVPFQGSGDLAAMARANCFVVVPEEGDQRRKSRLKAGATVRILLP